MVDATETFIGIFYAQKDTSRHKNILYYLLYKKTLRPILDYQACNKTGEADRPSWQVGHFHAEEQVSSKQDGIRHSGTGKLIDKQHRLQAFSLFLFPCFCIVDSTRMANSNYFCSIFFNLGIRKLNL